MAKRSKGLKKTEKELKDKNDNKRLNRNRN